MMTLPPRSGRRPAGRDGEQGEGATLEVTSYRQGQPAWADLVTADVGWMIKFYHAVFGWEDRPQPTAGGPDYHMQLLDGVPVAAISRQPPEESRNGVPPYWNVFLAVDDVDAVAAATPAAGGEVLMPPANVMDAGRLAVLADPTGARLGLWQARNHPGAGRIHEPGAMSWSELQTHDPDRAAAFLHELLGVEATPRDGAEGSAGRSPYLLLSVDGEPVGGISRIPQYRSPSWVQYFEVADIDEAIAAATAQGGNVLAAPAEEAHGRFATVQDPQGAVFGIIRSR